jgi:hypothetical protein
MKIKLTPFNDRGIKEAQCDATGLRFTIAKDYEAPGTDAASTGRTRQTVANCQGYIATVYDRDGRHFADEYFDVGYYPAHTQLAAAKKYLNQKLHAYASARSGFRIINLRKVGARKRRDDET